MHYLDTNILVRFLIKDQPALVDQARAYFQRADRGEMRLVIVPFILIEVQHVLRSVYGLSKESIGSALLNIIATPYLDVHERPFLTEAIRVWLEHPINFVDALLYVSARNDHAEVLSFDKDFRKLAATSK